jgi:ATP-dependent Clp protease ATP-binding subunit ClpA
LILTTNAGARELATRSVGFARGDAAPVEAGPGRSKEVIEKVFAPEFRNRLDAWIAFSPLSPDAIGRVVDKLVGELATQLAEKQVTLTLSPDARAYFARKGYDPSYGARPMARLIQNELKKPLAEILLFGALKGRGGRVAVEIAEDRPKLIVTPPTA